MGEDHVRWKVVAFDSAYGGDASNASMTTSLHESGDVRDKLAMKLLTAREGRARDWDDALGLLHVNPRLDLALVSQRLALIASRGLLGQMPAKAFSSSLDGVAPLSP